jgi:mannose-6-phosphate isomerase-like protein (cupin superfamily)
MSWTKKNLAEVEDAAARHGVGGGFEARFPGGDLEAQATGLCHQRFGPGVRSAFAHRHKEAEEVYVVLSGSGRASLDGEIVELQPLDALRVAPPVLRAFEGGAEGLELLVVGPRRQGDGEIVQEDVFA